MEFRQLILLLIGMGMLVATVNATAADDGQQLYQTHCSQCHGIDGQGFRRVYPPLQGSSYFDQKLMRLPCIIRNGLSGNIRLQDGTYNRTMPGNTSLDADQVALLIRYTSRFAAGDSSAATTTITPKKTAQLMQQCQ